MREIEKSPWNNIVVIVAGDPPMHAKLSGQKFEEKSDKSIVSKYVLQDT